MRAVLRLLATSIGLAMAVVPAAAQAANSVIDSDPRPGSSTELEPSRVTIAFADDISAESTNIVVRDASGRNILSSEHLVEGNNLYANLPYPLPAGLYTVDFRALDGRVPFGGSFQFAYDSSDKPRGQRTWRSAENIPSVIALPEDQALRDAASATQGGTDAQAPPLITPSPGLASQGGNEALSPSSADSAQETHSNSWVWWLAGIVAVGLAGGVGWVVRRRHASTGQS